MCMQNVEDPNSISFFLLRCGKMPRCFFYTHFFILEMLLDDHDRLSSKMFTMKLNKIEIKLTKIEEIFQLFHLFVRGHQKKEKNNSLYIFDGERKLFFSAFLLLPHDNFIHFFSAQPKKSLRWERTTHRSLMMIVRRRQCGMKNDEWMKSEGKTAENETRRLAH